MANGLSFVEHFYISGIQSSSHDYFIHLLMTEHQEELGIPYLAQGFFDMVVTAGDRTTNLCWGNDLSTTEPCRGAGSKYLKPSSV